MKDGREEGGNDLDLLISESSMIDFLKTLFQNMVFLVIWTP
jgi:hypothetical protein